MNELMSRISKVGIKSVGLDESEVYQNRDITSSSIPCINIALSGEVDGGFGSGVGILAGPSKHYKSNTALILVSDYLKKHKDAMCLFYDSEFGTPPSYWATQGIDSSRVLHVPIENIEDIKFDLPQKLESIKLGDKVIIFVDSVGNLPSKKEATDALDGKSTTDMTRARELKSLFRIVTPKIKLRNLPALFVAHTYQTMELYSKAVVSGGCLQAGTKIQMSDNTLKNIEDIIAGEYVKTLDGDKSVTYTWNPETLENGTPECYEIEFEDGYKVICSDIHKFLIDDKWVDANKLHIGMDVSVV